MYCNCVRKCVIFFLVGVSSSFLFGKSVLADACDETNIQKYIAQFESKEEFVQDTALSKVVGCGEKSIQPLSYLLESKQSDPIVRVKAVESLGMISSSVPEKLKGKIPLLVRILKDKNENQLVRSQIASALHDLFVEAIKNKAFKEEEDLQNIQDAGKILIASLKDVNPKVRMESVSILGEIATSEIDAESVEQIFKALVPLIQVKNEPDPTVRRNAVYALGKIVNSYSSSLVPQ